MTRSMRSIASICAVTAIIYGITANNVRAQEAANSEAGWGMACISDQLCELKYEIIRDSYVAARVSVLNVRGYFLLQYTVPVGIDIIRGVSVSIDDGEATSTIISNCTAYGCTGQLGLTPEVISSMKNGSELKINFVSPFVQEYLSIPFSLHGFTEGFIKITS